MASDSLTFPQNTCVVRKSWCLRDTLDTISKGIPLRLAHVAEYPRKSLEEYTYLFRGYHFLLFKVKLL